MPPQSWANRTDVQRPEMQVSAPPAPVPLWDSVQANFRDGRDNRRRNARYEALDSEMWARHRQIEQRLGRKFDLSRSLAGVGPQGERDGLERFLDGIIDPEKINAAILGQRGLREDDAYEAALEAERRRNPTLFEGIESREAMLGRLDARLNAVRSQANDASQGVGGTVGAFIGQGAAIFTDPAEAGVILATGGLGASRSLLTRMGTQAAVGGTLEAVQAPQRAIDARIAGPDYTAAEAGMDIIFGAVGGAGGEAVMAGGRGGLRAIQGRLAASTEAGERGVSRQIEQLLADEDIIGTPEDFDGARQALATGQALPSVELDRDLDDLFSNQSPAEVSGPVSQSQPETGGLDATTYRGRRIYSGRFDPMAVEVDAARFQYKAEGDAEGVTQRLRGVERWDATASGKAILFEDTDGRVIVADGHQRRGLARRLAEQGWDDARLDAILFKASDGWTPREVRVVAALKNIREGSGTAMDAAKVFREAPQALADRSLPLSGEFMGQARNLAALSDDAFRAVVNGVVPERFGAVIGEQAAARGELHADLIELLRRAEPKSVEGARAMVQEGLLDDFIKAEGRQMDLFGGLPRESTVIARGRIREAVMAGLRKDERLNAALVRNADAIEAGGNILARSDNEKKLAIDRAASELVSRLALRSGDMGEAFGLAASAVTKNEMTPAAAAKGLIQRIRAAVAAGERLDVERAAVIDPKAPSAQALEAVSDFDRPGGVGQKAQLVDKPEDIEIETEAASLGLFDDLPETVSEERALGVLRACAPGKAA